MGSRAVEQETGELVVVDPGAIVDGIAVPCPAELLDARNHVLVHVVPCEPLAGAGVELVGVLALPLLQHQRGGHELADVLDAHCVAGGRPWAALWARRHWFDGVPSHKG